ncbi:Nuclear pore complex subunit, partial [Kickxella alabastrina]
ILNDIDRLGGSMWSQVSAQCIAVIKTATSQLQAEQGAGADVKKTGGVAVLPPQSRKPAAEPIVMSAMSGGAPMMDILQQHRRQRDNVAGPKAPAAVVSAQNLFEPEAQGLEKYVLTTLRDALLQSAVGQRILSRSHRARSTMAFANFQLQVWAVRSLMRLVECSLEEDKYGVVQGDIAKVLETLFVYLAALEKCMLSVESSSSAAADAADLGGKGGAFNVQTSARQPWVMAQVVRCAIYAFTTRFYLHLEALKLPPKLGRQLQKFADFQA